MITRRLFFCSLLLLVALQSIDSHAQRNDANTNKAEKYFQSIRNNEALLTDFFQAMPKGGDLHHHFSGALYGEEMYEIARDQGYYVNLSTFEVTRQQPPQTETSEFAKISDYKGPIDIRSKLLRLWSVKDFVTNNQESSETHFFQTFGKFGVTISGFEDSLLRSIKRRAIAEHTQYIETMLVRPNFDHSNQQMQDFLVTNTNELIAIQQRHDSVAAHALFEKMYNELMQRFGFQKIAQNHYNAIVGVNERAKLSPDQDSLVTIRYQNYVGRTSIAADVFAQLVPCFQSCDNNLIVGVNIVAPEDDPTSMRDYWLHMQMFAFLSEKFPKVQYAMHAGELTLGFVKPEDLQWHIRSAVLSAGAKRIGHGVDIAYEKDCDNLLDYMHLHHIAIEINLTSNEFILGVKNERHPFDLYYKHQVPIVISTDDPGVLRSNHTEQFVLLATRYHQIDYKQIKEFVYNSIKYSFMNGADKDRLQRTLDDRFAAFERSIK